MSEPGAIDQVWDVLGTIIDPELGLPVTDLGLIYEVDVREGIVSIDMTTTTPICPLGNYLVSTARDHVLALPWVTEAKVELVSQPAWTPERLSQHARRMLGLAG